MSFLAHITPSKCCITALMDMLLPTSAATKPETEPKDKNNSGISAGDGVAHCSSPWHHGAITENQDYIELQAETKLL